MSGYKINSLILLINLNVPSHNAHIRVPMMEQLLYYIIRANY